MHVSLNSAAFIRIALGLVYFHFGFLKFFPDLSPAELLATQTIMRLSASWLDARTALWALALLECLIGVTLVLGLARRWVLGLFVFHMIGTVMPLFLLPELTFKVSPLAPTLEGQYIIKNVVFIAAGWAVLFPRAQRQHGVLVTAKPSQDPIA